MKEKSTQISTFKKTWSFKINRLISNLSPYQTWNDKNLNYTYINLCKVYTHTHTYIHLYTHKNTNTHKIINIKDSSI